LKFPKVGVDVATANPLALVESSVFTAAPESVRVDTAKFVVVALVVVALIIERLVMEEEALEMTPPVKVVSPETLREERVPREVSEEETTELPKVEAERMFALLMSSDPPVERFRLPEESEIPPPKVEVLVLETMRFVRVVVPKLAVPVAVNWEAVRREEKSPSPWTEKVA
jgi:hypothetical protein